MRVERSQGLLESVNSFCFSVDLFASKAPFASLCYLIATWEAFRTPAEGVPLAFATGLGRPTIRPLFPYTMGVPLGHDQQPDDEHEEATDHYFASFQEHLVETAATWEERS
ncbi:MAG: hypothetical protein JWP08_4536 [Bryobacterales bacterium]|jgi:hypothetical protein|nr:hypothetical protein [Bryobacterales bacterium]